MFFSHGWDKGWTWPSASWKANLMCKRKKELLIKERESPINPLIETYADPKAEGISHQDPPLQQASLLIQKLSA